MTTTIAFTSGIAIALALVLRGWLDYRAGRGIRYTLILAAVCIVTGILGWFFLPHVPAQRLSPPVPVTLGVYGGLAVVFGALAFFEWRRQDAKRAKLMVVYWVGSVSVFSLAWHYLPLPPVR
jgi:hypothetical protein